MVRSAACFLRQGWGVTLAVTVLILSGCGGGDAPQVADATANEASQGPTASAVLAVTSTPVAATASVSSSTPATTEARAQALSVTSTSSGLTRAEAFRLLTQASFGPTEAALTQAMQLGAAGWLDQQFALPATAVHLARFDADDQRWRATHPGESVGSRSVISSFYERALRGDDQLRQRVVFALSEIFVVSLQDLGSTRAQAVASWLDMLNAQAFGNYRTLLEQASLHPAMGQYLSALANRPADPLTGRIPDQNYAREVMQLFTIGLRELNQDGSPRLDSQGRAIDTYAASDVVGLSQVFTGFSWAGPDTSARRFKAQKGWQDPKRMVLPMQAYPQFHDTSATQFLGVQLAAGRASDAKADLRRALDTLFAHPNVGPFIARQLIQRLVTSHPSPAYVARVAAVFNNNGKGVRGDLQAVVRALLLDDEARNPASAAAPGFGKLREPVLRLTALLRAFDFSSNSGQVLMAQTDDPGESLGQTPLNAPSVFNFFRPGYIPPGGEAETLRMTVPEMQITSESSVAGYVNYMVGLLTRGVGMKGWAGSASQRDLQLKLQPALALAGQPAALVDLVNARLLGGRGSNAWRNELIAAVTSLPVPVAKADGSNQAAVATAQGNRVRIALVLALASPEFIVQQ